MTNINKDELMTVLGNLISTDEGKDMLSNLLASNTQGNNNGNTANNQPQVKVEMLSVPSNIHVEPFLVDFIESVEKPETITDKLLIDIGAEAFKAKVAHIEMANINLKSGKLRIPNKLDFDDVAVIMMSLFTFKNIQLTEQSNDSLLAMYEHTNDSSNVGIYNTSKNRMFEIMGRIAPSFRKRDMEDVLDKITRDVGLSELTQEKHLFAVNNGIFNQKTKELEPFSNEYVYLTKIPINYLENPISPVYTASDGYQWDVESWLLDIFSDDKETVELLWQVISDCLQPNVSRHRSIWFYSEQGNNGKGTVGQLIKNLLGRGNYSSLSVADFNHEFMKSRLINAVANIADENDVDMYIDSVKDFKASITGDDININRKYEEPINVQFKGTNIQMMNGLPKTKDKSDSFYRRIILVPFLKSFTNNGERTYIKSDYIQRDEVLEYVLHKALHLEFESFIIPASSVDIMSDYKESNNPVMEYWNEYKDRFTWDLLPTGFLYDTFKVWFSRNNPSGRVMARRSFISGLRAVIKSQGDNWEDKSGSGDKVRSNGRMDDDEPLISEFGLDVPSKVGDKASEWCNEFYTGTNLTDKRRFARKATYRGFVRF